MKDQPFEGEKGLLIFMYFLILLGNIFFIIIGADSFIWGWLWD